MHIFLCTRYWHIIITESDVIYITVIVMQCVQVHFSSEAPVHIVLAGDEKWAADYKQARIGHWEALARDRVRFMKRIEQMEQTISWVLTPQHRSRVFSRLQE